MFWKRRPPQTPAPKPTQARRPNWSAASIIAPETACPAAKALKGKRFLSREAPGLPLPDCTQPGTCSCRYRKHDDRREGPRREMESSGLRRPVPADQDRRRKRGRRRSDYED